MNQRDLDILRSQYHLQVYYVCIGYGGERDSNKSYDQNIVFNELPDDFKIDDVNDITGEVTLSTTTIKKICGNNFGDYYGGYENNFERAYIVEKKHWKNLLNTLIARRS